LAVRIAEDEGPQARRDLREQQLPLRVEVRDVSVVRAGPAPVLEGVAVQHVDLPLGGLAHVRQDRLRRDHPAQAMEQHVAEGRERAPGHVGRPVDVERHSPAVRVLIALHSEGVVRGEQGPVHLARNDATEPEQPTHRGGDYAMDRRPEAPEADLPARAPRLHRPRSAPWPGRNHTQDPRGAAAGPASPPPRRSAPGAAGPSQELAHHSPWPQRAGGGSLARARKNAPHLDVETLPASPEPRKGALPWRATRKKVGPRCSETTTQTAEFSASTPARGPHDPSRAIYSK